MNNLNDEQRKRLEQVRVRQARCARPDRDDVPQRTADPLARALSRELRQAQIDRGFLLSLIDSKAAEGDTPFCAVHQRLEDADALECEVGNDCVACSLNERRELLGLIAPFAAEGNTEDSVTVLRRVAEFYATHVGEGRVIVSYPAANPIPDPASAMRNKCVEKVKELAKAHRVMAQVVDAALGEMQKIRAEECDAIADALPALTLDQEKQQS